MLARHESLRVRDSRLPLPLPSLSTKPQLDQFIEPSNWRISFHWVVKFSRISIHSKPLELPEAEVSRLLFVHLKLWRLQRENQEALRYQISIQSQSQIQSHTPASSNSTLISFSLMFLRFALVGTPNICKPIRGRNIMKLNRDPKGIQNRYDGFIHSEQARKNQWR